jgi:hypothetical protein
LRCNGLLGRKERGRLDSRRCIRLSRRGLLVGRLSVRRLLRRVLRLILRLLRRVLLLLRLRLLRRVLLLLRLRLLRRVLGGIGRGRDRLDRRSRLVAIVAFYGVLEAAQGLADRRAGIGQLSRADDDQNDD